MHIHAWIQVQGQSGRQHTQSMCPLHLPPAEFCHPAASGLADDVACQAALDHQDCLCSHGLQPRNADTMNTLVTTQTLTHFKRMATP